MTGLDEMLTRLTDLDCAVRCYLSHLYAIEQGAESDEELLDYWRSEMERLTS
jgi:hypothetical protein